MGLKLVGDELIESVQRRTGLSHFDSDSFHEGLSLFLSDFNAQDIPEPLVLRQKEQVITMLAKRLKVTAYLDNRPELLERPVERPVFVFGIPRTGTTLLSNLLACDPGRRSPLTWEIDDPIPPPTTAALRSDPRALARIEQQRQALVANPESGKYYRASAIYPFECLGFMQSDFKTVNLEARGRMPNFREWVFSTDVSSSYAYHKRFLQVLQADAPGVWNLKMPSHALWLETLLKTYPDARLVWTHRDPLTATASFCSLVASGHQQMIGRIDTDWIAEDMPWQAVQHADRIMDARERVGHERVIDLHYADLMRQPIPTMRRLYKALGDEFTADIEAGMQAWLDDNPQGKFGRHEYKLAQYGLTPEGVRMGFERYLSAHNVEFEG